MFECALSLSVPKRCTLSLLLPGSKLVAVQERMISLDYPKFNFWNHSDQLNNLQIVLSMLYKYNYLISLTWSGIRLQAEYTH